MPAPITHIADLTPDPENVRTHNPRNVGMIQDALQEVGAARSIVIDEAGVILAGNATVEAAAAAGITRVHVVDADGETLIAVRRTGLSSPQKTRLALFDNRGAELAGWDRDRLVALAEDGLLGGLFYDDELAALGEPEPLDPAALWAGMPDFEQADLEAYKKTVVHFLNEDDYQAFFRLVGQAPNAKAIWYPAQANVPMGLQVDDES